MAASEPAPGSDPGQSWLRTDWETAVRAGRARSTAGNHGPRGCHTEPRRHGRRAASGDAPSWL